MSYSRIVCISSLSLFVSLIVPVEAWINVNTPHRVTPN